MSCKMYTFSKIAFYSVLKGFLDIAKLLMNIQWRNESTAMLRLEYFITLLVQ